VPSIPDQTFVLVDRNRAMRGLIRVAVATAATAVALLLFEGAARLYARATNQPRGITVDTSLGWRPLPGVRKIGDLWGVSRPAVTNTKGWRDAERSYEKPSGMRRAVAIGDSFTYGVEVDDGERFTDILPDRVARLEVVNLGVPGWGTDQELRLLETEAFRYHPDVIIWTICVFNDLDDIGYERRFSMPKPHYTLEDHQLRLWSADLTWTDRLRASSYLVEGVYRRVYGPVGARLVPGFTAAYGIDLFDALVRRIASITREHGSQLVVVLAEAPQAPDPDWTIKTLPIASSLERVRVPTLDARTLFGARSADPARLLYARFGHWNARGHAIVAEGIQELLAQIGIR